MSLPDIAPIECPGVLVLGAAKSGTTALFYAIRAAMIARTGRPVAGAFEPTAAGVLQAYLEAAADPAPLAKILLRPFFRDFVPFLPRFDKVVAIHRDPRDNIVSRLLYRPRLILPVADEAKVVAYLALLRRKEADPSSLSVTEILTELQRLSGETDTLESFRVNALLPARLLREFGDRLLMLPYEELVAGRFDRLNAYLGLDVGPDYALDARHAYVTRRKTPRDWVNWFLEEDLPYFVHDVAEDYRLLGFDPDERPAPPASLDPAMGSLYLAEQFRTVREKQERLARIAQKG